MFETCILPPTTRLSTTGTPFSQHNSAATLLADVLLYKILHGLRCLRCWLWSLGWYIRGYTLLYLNHGSF